MAENQRYNERQVVAKGNWGSARGDHTGATVVTRSGSGEWGEAALKGHLFCGYADTNTIAAGNVNAAAAAATTNTGLLNPVGSNTLMLIQRVTVAIQSGTLAAGGIYHSVSKDTTILTSVVGFSQGQRCNNFTSQDSVGYVLDSNAGVALTGSTALTTLFPFIGTTAAAVTTGLLAPANDVVGGAIILGPGDMYLPTFTGAGTTVIANFGYLWTEVPALTNP